MKFSHRSKLNDIPRRNIEKSITDSKRDSDKDKNLNAYFVIQLSQTNMSNDISSRALIRSMILMDTSLLIVIRFFSWRKYNRFTCRNTLETKFSFLKLFRNVKLLLWKVLLPRHARQPLHLPTMHRQYVSLPVYKVPATSAASMCISPTTARNFAGHSTMHRQYVNHFNNRQYLLKCDSARCLAGPSLCQFRQDQLQCGSARLPGRISPGHLRES